MRLGFYDTEGVLSIGWYAALWRETTLHSLFLGSFSVRVPERRTCKMIELNI